LLAANANTFMFFFLIRGIELIQSCLLIFTGFYLFFMDVVVFCGNAQQYTCHSREDGNLWLVERWIPACAGMTMLKICRF